MEQKRVPLTFKFDEKPHIMVIEGRFYNDVADLLLAGAQKVLTQVEATVDVFTVPGALEIPAAITYAVRALDFDAVRRRFDGYVALGCVLRGDTNHHEIVGMQSARSLQDLTLNHALAIGNGILTCDTHTQALERANPDGMDRGGAAAEACLRLLELKQRFRLSAKRRWVAR